MATGPQQPYGRWVQNPRTKEFSWVYTTGPPSPTDIGKYGEDALYNPAQSPDGEPAGDRVGTPPAPVADNGTDVSKYHGYWARYRGGGGVWQWETVTGDWIGYKLGPEYLDPTKTPDGTVLFDAEGNAINGGNPRYQGQYLPNGKPNPYYIPPNVDAPAVAVKTGWPRDFTGSPLQASTSGNGEQKVPSHSAFSIHLANLRTAETNILTSVKTRITEYDAVKNQFAGDKYWIFTVNNADVLHPYERGKTYNVDPHPGLTSQMTRIGDNLLMAVGDVLKVAGDLTMALDTAGQLYSKADIESTFPTS